jgi:DNA replication protein DnaC
MRDTFDELLTKVLTASPPTEEQIAERERQEAEQQRQERNKRCWDAWNKLTAPMGVRYRDCTLQNYVVTHESQRKVLDEIQKYAGEIDRRVSDGQGLVLFGPSGTGKDHLLTGLSRAAVARDLTIRWINGSNLYRAVRQGIGEAEEDLVNRYVWPRILYISDPIPPIGGLTPFQASTLFAIIDGRYRDKKAIWATMNVSDAQEAEQRLGAAVVDRLRDGAISLRCFWSSYRKGAQ